MVVVLVLLFDHCACMVLRYCVTRMGFAALGIQGELLELVTVEGWTTDFNDEAVMVLSALPYLDVGQHETLTALQPSTYPLSHLGLDRDEG